MTPMEAWDMTTMRLVSFSI